MMLIRDLHVVWFKHDLRVVDHRPLLDASKRGTVLPLFIVEPDLWAEPDMSGRHWDFASECLVELRRDLNAIGQPLIVRVGDAVPVLQKLHADIGIASLYSHEETGNGWTYRRDEAVRAWCRDAGVRWTEHRQTGVQRRLASRDGWARAWDAFMAEPASPAPTGLRPIEGMPLGEFPDATDLGLAKDPCPARQVGGRSMALSTLTEFLTVRGRPYRAAMSSPVTGETACSRMSPYLAWGAVSMREVTQATWARQKELKIAADRSGWRGSLKSFNGRLHWHCHFMQKLEDAPSIEWTALHPATRGLRDSVPDATRLAAWSAGETGLPFVDACMRYLRAGGWLNFRMRAMVMAVASYHLWLDWRKPGEVLARLFTDYEPGIHWPQVQMQSGTTGINTVRIYNPVKQGTDQDPTGVFTRRWVPELAPVPDTLLQTPWRWEGANRLLDRAYPAPIVDPLEAAKAARTKIWSARGGATFREEASRIQSKHGSRKSGIPNTGRRNAKPGAARRASKQMTLDI